MNNDSNFIKREDFDFLNFDITNSNSNNVNSNQQFNSGNLLNSQFDDNLFLDDLDTFGLTPGINVIGDEEESTPTPQPFDQTAYIDINTNNRLSSSIQANNINSNNTNENSGNRQRNNSNNLPPNSYQSLNASSYAASYNNLNFNNNNLTNLISPNEFSDFENSPYGSSFNPDSLKSPPMNSPNFSPSSLTSSTKYLSKEEKLRRRREFHNAVERRRRDLIKDRIKELGQLIPPSLLFEIQFNKEGKEITKESRANKSIILNKTVDYILHLQSILRSQDERLEVLANKVNELSGDSNASIGNTGNGAQ